MRRAKLCYVVAATVTVEAFLRPHIARASRRFEIHVVANGASRQWAQSLGLPVTAHALAIERRIAPMADLAALARLVRLFRRERFDIVHSVTPKAGLLAALAGRASDVPHRVHTFTGQVWATRRGLMRAVLRSADRLVASLCTQVLVDSPSQREFLLREGVARAERSTVLGKGSICGVDAERFRPDGAARAGLRAELGIPENDVVLLFLGRLNRDKGILDLARAFSAICGRYPHLRLLLVGADEDRLEARVRAMIGGCGERLHCVGHTGRPEHFYAAADLLCLPSYREGFGMAVIEAAACGIAATGSRIYGLTDAIEEGVTGLLHAPGDASAIAAVLARLIDDPALRAQMGARARARALRDFSRAALADEQGAFYEKILAGSSGVT